MIPILVLEKIRLNSFSKIADAITALATIVIVSNDLGLPHSESEKKFYTHPLIQILALFCVGYEMLQNLSITFIIVTIWLIVKYYKKLCTSISDRERD